MTEPPRVSVVVPAYNEGEHIAPVLDRIFESVRLQCEVLVVVDSAKDNTVPVITAYADKEPRLRCIVNTYGRGPANAIRYGIATAAAPVAVVTMADGCDDPRQIDDLARLVDRGVAVAAASRYMPGGQQVGPTLAVDRIAARREDVTERRVGAHYATAQRPLRERSAQARLARLSSGAITSSTQPLAAAAGAVRCSAA